MKIVYKQNMFQLGKIFYSTNAGGSKDWDLCKYQTTTEKYSFKIN